MQSSMQSGLVILPGIHFGDLRELAIQHSNKKFSELFYFYYSNKKIATLS